MTTRTAVNKPPSLASPSSRSCSLVPVRVDVISDDGSIRIVETMLWDPHCWPVSPLSSFPSLSQAVEANVQSVAHSLLADLEVQGMGRTQRHFTGRVELWTPQLQAKIADQLRPQLLQLASDYHLFGSTSSLKSANEKSTAPSTTSSSSASTTATSISSLREIPIRLDFNGILIQDDVVWCDTPSTTTTTTDSTNCPVAISKSITEDLQLPDDAAVAICTALVEQIHGSSAVALTDATTTIPKVKRVDASVGADKKRRRVSGAWSLDSRDHLVKVNYVVAVHKPSSTATTTSSSTTT